VSARLGRGDDAIVHRLGVHPRRLAASGGLRARLHRLAARLALPAAIGLGAAVVAAAPARAGTEEFSTFSVEAQEEDDESLIDHILTRTPRAWDEEWERAPQALRTSQACLTSGQWLTYTDLKLRAPLGERAWFGFNFTQREDDRTNYDFLDFSFHVPTRLGTAVGMFRPFHDKSRQDFALMWDVGADTSTVQLRLVAGLEDLFNNFWAFRQSRNGSDNEPYLRRPWEPGLRLVVRQPRLRLEVGGRYLTPSRKRIVISFVDESLNRVRTLWGTLGWASVDARALGLDWELRSTNHQATSTDAPWLEPQLDGRDFRRQWSFESTVHRRWTRRLEAEARWLYQGRTQRHGPPIGPRTFDAVDRVLQIETTWTASRALALRFGGMRDRITVADDGGNVYGGFAGYGTRAEDRLYIGLMSRFGRVRLQGIEGIELDHEPYKVSGVHDKGFLQLQTTF
jgi:hypothetical protein